MLSRNPKVQLNFVYHVCLKAAWASFQVANENIIGSFCAEKETLN